MKKIQHLKLKILVVAMGLAASVAQASVIANWTFETSIPTTAGSFAAENGVGSALGFHTGVSTYSSPVGNGSLHSFSSNTWAVGDYYQFQVSTLGLSSIVLSWDQTSSSTGPKDFILDYSMNGTTFTQFAQYSVLANATPNSWSSTAATAASSFSYDLSNLTAINNQANIYFRLIDNSTTSANGLTVATAGTDRVDNFIVTSNVSAVPVPGAIWLFGSAMLGMIGFKRRKV